jgi:hypothetical protein
MKGKTKNNWRVIKYGNSNTQGKKKQGTIYA